MKRIGISERIFTVLLTIIITVPLLLISEYLILGKSTVKLAAISFLIEHNYPGNINPENEYKALVSSLGDPFSRYFDPDEYRMYYIDNNKYVGIGVVVSINNNEHTVTVNSVTSGSPAEDAGILMGDVIYSVDGTVIDETNYLSVAEYIKGEENTSVNVEVIRGNEHISMDIMRKDIKSPAVTGMMYDDSIGIIHIRSFSENSGNEFIKAYNELISLGMTKMIINLNNNSGGLLKEAMIISDMFLPKDTLVTYMTDKNGKRTNYITSNENEINIPTVILVNENSASASEMFSGAMQHYKKAVLVGEKTYGKGVAQSMITFRDKSSLNITAAKYYLPNDVCIHEIGLTPDYEVSMEDGGIAQAEKALELLGGSLNKTSE